MVSAVAPAVPRPVRSWIRPVARVGFAAKGVVYITIGLLAARSVAGLGGGRGPSGRLGQLGQADTRGAIRTLGRQPFGDVLLLGVGLGLAAYAAWRIVQAVFDVDSKGGDAKGLFVRSGFLGSALLHLGLAATALGLFATGQPGGPSAGIEHWTARALSRPFGPWVVCLVGAGVAGVGVYQLYKAYGARFEKRLALERLDLEARAWVRRIGQLGLAARGVTFAIIGGFLVQAARHADPREARGLAGSLRLLREQPHGDVLLGAVAFGLIAYGVHCLVLARLRELPE